VPTLHEHAGGGPRFIDSSRRSHDSWHLIDVHRGLRITEAQRQRFVELDMAALDAAGMPDDEAFRTAVREHVELGSRVAMQNSHAATDAELHRLREVPHWTWVGDDLTSNSGPGQCTGRRA
jgi:hypothetical protein